ncbi:chlorite dismutase family protein [Leucobacter luti]|uniref:hydrogen peroxide-dependent heme synthase n=1 Tax=Leucobacter luti TaxID=340320 RepID=A0A4Q7TZK9_9MICO|nr:chlorite dismutase family protein [Leucobacter luti]MBL3699072.1 chlorite dismutase [Leucobacter luti]RZT66574.1 chlorite dismutase [Leucobacter luti]
MSADANPTQAPIEQPAHAAPPGEVAFSLFAVFRLSSSHPVVLDGREVPEIVQELEDVAASLAAERVFVRGWYDVSGFRSDADLMVWLHGTEIEDLQWALRQLRRCALLRPLIRAWSAIGADPGPGDDLGTSEPAEWLACASAEISDATPLSGLDADGDVALHVFDAAGLTDAGWLVAAEADDPVALTGLVRAIQSGAPIITDVRTRYTGRFIEPAEIVEVLQ